MSPDWAVDHGHLCVWKLESVDFRCLSRGIENKQGILRASGQASPSRPLREGGEMLAWSVGAAPWGGETYQLVGRQGKDTEHEMAGDLGMSAYPDMAPAELVLEAGVGPLDTGPDPETHAPGVDMACHPPGNGISSRIRRHFLKGAHPWRADGLRPRTGFRWVRPLRAPSGSTCCGASSTAADAAGSALQGSARPGPCSPPAETTLPETRRTAAASYMRGKAACNSNGPEPISADESPRWWSCVANSKPDEPTEFSQPKESGDRSWTKTTSVGKSWRRPTLPATRGCEMI